MDKKIAKVERVYWTFWPKILSIKVAPKTRKHTGSRRVNYARKDQAKQNCQFGYYYEPDN